MGKNWKGKYQNRQYGGSNNDIASCRGHGVIIATCDTAREKEATKELMNLVAELVEEGATVNSNAEITTAASAENSIEAMLKQEIADVQDTKSGKNQLVKSINPGVKGVVLVKITDVNKCPVDLVKKIFEKIKKEKKSYSRHLVRLVPIKYVTFPREKDLILSIDKLLEDEFSIIREPEEKSEIKNDEIENSEIKNDEIEKSEIKNDEIEKFEINHNEIENSEINNDEKVTKISSEGDRIILKKQKLLDDKDFESELVYKKENENDSREEIIKSSDSKNYTKNETTQKWETDFRYSIMFKARNNNVLLKDAVFSTVRDKLEIIGRNDQRIYQNVVMVEAIKSICGISLVRDYNEYMEFNIRKFQNQHAAENDNSI